MNAYENQITSLFKVMDRVRKVWRSVTPCENLTKSQFGTLMAIRHYNCQNDFDQKNKTITISDLANVMHQSNPALSQRIKVLEEMGYIERVASINDRRVNGVRLSNRGDEILEVARTRIHKIMSAVIEDLGIDESEKLIESLTKLADAFEEVILEEGGNN